MEAFAAAVEASALGVFCRESAWAYPLVNVMHVLGATVLVGAVLAIDLRWMGWLGAVPAQLVSRTFTPLAASAFVVMALSGMLLFSADASALVKSPVFGLKLLVIGLAVVNAMVFRGLRPDRAARHGRVAATLSLTLWFGVIILGRLIAYL